MIYNKKVTALVPIKADTELINGNLRMFNNKPLYKSLLDKLENIFAIDEILVDTDIKELESELAKLYNKVKFVSRPLELSGSDIDINDVLKYDVSQSPDGEIYIQTHINKPLLKKETIAKALKKFVELEDQYDSLFSVNTYKSRFYNHHNQPINHEKEHLIRTRKLDPVYEENSCFYIFTKESFNATNHRIGNKPFLFDISSIEAIELEDGLSYKLAEILMLYQEL
ncbi:cytidylyltransferase domain-containing protein [Roseimarinus sediminis]|uniref:cytidylyltransferase domain-containing protein n=1 Tax=Roseimarinus sediminis TaxID=1610899 RepID=UPI003D1A5EAB